MQPGIYFLAQTLKTPLVSFDPSTGKFEMKGTSIPEDSIGFYKPLLAWLDEYIENPAPSTVLDIQLDYFNTSSSKCIFNIILKIDKIMRNEKGKAEINWIHEDDDDGMIDAGESFMANVEIPFRMIPFTDPE